MSGLDPRTWIPSIGKSEKASKSPAYQAAIRAMDSIDREVRKTFEKQKALIPVLRWSKFKMNLSKFAHAADAFLKYQLYIDALLSDPAITKGLNDLMQQFILDLYGKEAAGHDFIKINPSDKLSEIASEIQTVKGNFQKPDIDWRTVLPEQKPSSVSPKPPAQTAAASADNELVKEAVFGWLHKLPELQNLTQNIKDLYGRIVDMYTNNKRYLKALAKAYNSGSVQNFTEVAKEFHGTVGGDIRAAKSLWGAQLAGIVEQHRKRIEVIESKEREAEEERQRKQEARRQSEDQPLTEPEDEQALSIPGPQGNQPVVPEKPKDEQALTIPGEEVQAPAESESGQFEKIPGTPGTATQEFMDKIRKIAVLTQDPYRIAYEVLVFAEKVEAEDPDLANKLMAIAEEAFDE
jgi:hypothetical protein